MPELLAKDFTCGQVADYKAFSFVDGQGVRCALYLSGCMFKCPGCFNRAAQNFEYGNPYTDELEADIICDLSENYVQGLTLLGGEPFLNTPTATRLARKVREVFADEKDIWAWSGYTFEELFYGSPDKRELLELCDVLIDGQFKLAERNLNLQFRGSENQRIIDVQKSIAAGRAIWWAQAMDEKAKLMPDTRPELIDKREMI
ncbi:MAG: anaerobic ribonucleoside-triphosphate reductase activating protein [Lactobacillales bacterium]|jgi:anaerobic ribonucleoside-triphosphate reductase activating protein|nr:anaerobic ribonucleoside-triphosphate reductase activating protein [Lactobacillales bacterium]